MQVLLKNIKKIIQMEIIRKNLKDYFKSLGLDDDDILYPPLIRNMPMQVPMIGSKLEVVPFVKEIDPATKFVKLGWNLFVYGTDRKFLGYSVHESFANLDTIVNNDFIFNDLDTNVSVGDVIEFIVGTIEKKKADNNFNYPIVQPTTNICMPRTPDPVGGQYRTDRLSTSHL